MDDNEDFDPFEGKSEEERRELEEFVRGYFSIRAEMKKLDEELKVYEVRQCRFIALLVKDFQALTVDFYPEYGAVFPGVNSELKDLAEFLFDDVTDLCDHYLDEKPGYCRELVEPEFEITTRLDLFKDRTEISAYKEIMQVMTRKFEQDYVEDFYFKSYRKHIHLLLKRLSIEFVPEIYELTAQGFKELDGFLYIGMVHLFDIVREANPINLKSI